MKRVRRFLTLTASALLVLSLAGAAFASRENPYWSSETTAPADTIHGSWTSDNELTTRLSIEGHNSQGQNTRFVAGWVTPWVSSDSTLRESGELELLMAPTTSASLVGMVRFRERGESWSRWFEDRLPYREGLGMGGSSSWEREQQVVSSSSLIKWEWKLVGEIDGLAKLDALSVGLTADP